MFVCNCLNLGKTPSNSTTPSSARVRTSPRRNAGGNPCAPEAMTYVLPRVDTFARTLTLTVAMLQSVCNPHPQARAELARDFTAPMLT